MAPPDQFWDIKEMKILSSFRISKKVDVVIALEIQSNINHIIQSAFLDKNIDNF